MDVKTIGVIGATTLGRGIAYVAALGGYRTVLEEMSLHRLEAGGPYMPPTLDRRLDNGPHTPNSK